LYASNQEGRDGRDMWHALERWQMLAKFWSGNLKWKDHLEELGVDDIRMDLREIWWEGVDWIHLALDRDLWRELLNTEIKFWNSNKGGKFLNWLRDCYLSKWALLHVVVFSVSFRSLFKPKRRLHCVVISEDLFS
jgi:hypothetical protein